VSHLYACGKLARAACAGRFKPLDYGDAYPHANRHYDHDTSAPTRGVSELSSVSWSHSEKTTRMFFNGCTTASCCAPVPLLGVGQQNPIWTSLPGTRRLAGRIIPRCKSIPAKRLETQS
jgi:hypothetical protein